MNFASIKSILRPMRFLVIALACTVIFFSNILPAAAIGSNPTRPSEGSVQLDEIQRKSEEVTKADPLSLEETQREANKGINEIQGDSDKNQMFRPETSQQATSVEDRVEQFLEKVTGRD